MASILATAVSAAVLFFAVKIKDCKKRKSDM